MFFLNNGHGQSYHWSKMETIFPHYNCPKPFHLTGAFQEWNGWVAGGCWDYHKNKYTQNKQDTYDIQIIPIHSHPFPLRKQHQFIIHPNGLRWLVLPPPERRGEAPSNQPAANKNMEKNHGISWEFMAPNLMNSNVFVEGDDDLIKVFVD